jgi:Domain of unknown function (DUF3806)
MAFRRRREPSGPRIEELTPGEVTWLDDQLEVARLLAERYGQSFAGQPPSALALDGIVSGWLDDDDESRVDINVVVNGVGIALGHHLASAAGLAWVIATDENGTDLALHGQPGDIVVYPANLTAKRLVKGERGFVEPLLREMTRSIEERKAQG